MSLELRGITKRFGSLTANDSIDLAVGNGEIHAILGENGAGKSTLMNIVYGLLSPDEGTISVDGKVVTIESPLDALAAGIGMVHQHFMLIPVFTVAENIEMPTWTIKTNRSAEERIALAYKVFPKLERYMERGGNHLSGGERKMLSIARALALDPEILILDEPFEGLSPAIIPVISEGLSSIREMGRAVLMAESNAFHIPDYADRVYIIERGEIIFSGSVEEAKKVAQSQLSIAAQA